MGENGALLDIKDKEQTSYCVPLWMRDENIKLAIARTPNRIEPYPEGQAREEPIAVVGFGPSLNETWQRLRDFKTIITCSGSHKFLVERGIIPTYHCEVDPRAHKTKLIGPPCKETEYLISSTCHQAVFDHLEGFNVKVWHVFDSAEDALRTLPHGEWALTGGCSVGLRAITIARFLGYVNMHIFGMDGNEGASGKHAAEHPMQPKKHNTMVYCDVYGCSDHGTVYKTTPAMLAPSKGLWHELNQMPDVKPVFYGDSLVTHMWRHYVPDYKVQRKMIIGFHKPPVISPPYMSLNRQLHRENVAYGVGGGKHAEVVLKLVKATDAKSVLDYGCGKGYLAKSLPFPIWEYDPAIPGKEESPKPADLVVCTDMLEHIEPDYLGNVLADLQRVVKNVGYFTIHTGPAKKTLPDGRNTHLVQRPKDWWKRILGKFFTVGLMKESGPEVQVVVGLLKEGKKRSVRLSV